MINHEIRTPLTAIMGFTTMLKDELKSTEIYEMVQYMDIASLRLEKFLMVVLQITELKAKDSPIHLELIPVHELIDACKTRLLEKISNKKLAVGIEGDGLNLFIPGNKKLLQSCFESLLENAIKFSPEGGIIAIQVYIKDQEIMIEFIDEGPGFSEIALKTLYQFFAVGEQHVDQNAGLGLALVKLIMDAHEGKIEVFNHTGKGATVRLIFQTAARLSSLPA